MGKVNLFVVGKTKSGTSILCEYFKEHKDIFVPTVKEPRFFRDGSSKDRGLNCRKLTDYEKLYDFKQNKSYYGDFSPQYLSSINGARYIYEYNPDAMIIAIFREPVSFLKSVYMQKSKHFIEDIPDFKTKMFAAWSKKNSENIKLKEWYSEQMKYSKQLKKFLDLFPKNQVKVIIYEEFKMNNQKTIDEVCDFLGIERIKIKPKRANVAKIARFPKLRKFLHDSYVLRKTGQKILPFFIRKKWGEVVAKITLRKEEKKPSDPEFEKKLMKKLKPEVIKLNNTLHSYNLIDKNKNLVKIWGYDKV